MCLLFQKGIEIWYLKFTDKAAIPAQTIFPGLFHYPLPDSINAFLSSLFALFSKVYLREKYVPKRSEVFYPFCLEDVIPGILIGFVLPSIYSFVDFFLVQSGFRTPKPLEEFFWMILYMCSRVSNRGFSNM